jgi:hypothetical protein
MADVTHARIDELDPVEGFLEGFTFRRAGVELGVAAFGMSIIDRSQGAADHRGRGGKTPGPTTT